MTGGGAGFTLRTAGAADADAIAAMFSRSYRTLRFLPELHTVAEDRWFIANVILKECEVTVAERNGRIAGFLARQDQEIRLLFVDPDGLGQGAGSLLLGAAKGCGLPALELWCFQANARAAVLRGPRLPRRRVHRRRAQRGEAAGRPLPLGSGHGGVTPVLPGPERSAGPRRT